MTTALEDHFTATHDRLTERIASARSMMAEQGGHREIVRTADAFLVNACRHAGAVCDLLLPVARKLLPDGPERVRAYVQQCRRTERSFVRAKQRLYGEARMASSPWSAVWAEAVAEFETLIGLERRLVADLTTLPGGASVLASSIRSASEHAPTRPHPHSPHTGRLSHLARGLWARADRFWDAAEGRIVTDRVAPEPDDEVLPALAS